jgi:DNA-binding GntR family transcriptional regulator
MAADHLSSRHKARRPPARRTSSSRTQRNPAGSQVGTMRPAWGATPPVAAFEKSVRQQTADILRQSILNFQLKPGQRLIEREFIERLGVSRTTFREAIRELTAEGLVTVVSQKGARVSAPSVEEAADLYEVRSALECLAVTWFVERADDREVRSLKAAVKHFKRLSSLTSDILELLRAKEPFYEVLIHGARSSALQQLLEGINARVHALRATSLSHPGRVAQTVAELEAIAEAISERDAVRASRLCDQHIRNACRTALISLQESDNGSG